MSTPFEELIERAMHLGVPHMALPAEILGMARLLAEHAHGVVELDHIYLLACDPENRFARWAAIRALVMLGPDAVAGAGDALTARMALENFPPARQELHNALGLLPQPAQG